MVGVGETTEPKPVKLVVGLLTSLPSILEEVEADVGEKYGAIDGRSSLIPFDYTDYYDREMGEGIKRKFLSFENLIDPAELARIKLATNRIERRLAEDGDFEVERPVNIDPGYIGLSKLVLATTKNYSHRIYLRDGIYAEVTLQYRDQGYQPLPWTYPDYRSEEYLDFFETTRERYRGQLD